MLAVVHTRVALAAVAVLASACGGTGYNRNGWVSLSGFQGSASSADLTVFGSHGHCATVSSPQVTESASEVGIQVPLRITSDQCDAMAIGESFTIHLERPLAGRSVVDGHLNRHLPHATGST